MGLTRQILNFDDPREVIVCSTLSRNSSCKRKQKIGQALLRVTFFISIIDKVTLHFLSTKENEINYALFFVQVVFKNDLFLT